MGLRPVNSFADLSRPRLALPLKSPMTIIRKGSSASGTLLVSSKEATRLKSSSPNEIGLGMALISPLFSTLEIHFFVFYE
jgi:hypothetical protein